MRAVPWVVAALAAVFVPSVVAQDAPRASWAPAAPAPSPEPSPSPTPPPAPRPPFTNTLRVRAGKMKSPFGIERLQSAQGLLFVERSLANNIVPNRDVGVQVHGELAQGAFGYQLALLNGVTDGGNIDGDTNDAKDL